MVKKMLAAGVLSEIVTDKDAVPAAPPAGLKTGLAAVAGVGLEPPPEELPPPPHPQNSASVRPSIGKIRCRWCTTRGELRNMEAIFTLELAMTN
jgi:hypothetical protein